MSDQKPNPITKAAGKLPLLMDCGGLFGRLRSCASVQQDNSSQPGSLEAAQRCPSCRRVQLPLHQLPLSRRRCCLCCWNRFAIKP